MLATILVSAGIAIFTIGKQRVSSVMLDTRSDE